MENKTRLSLDEKEKKDSSLLKQRINNFLMNYFNYLAIVVALAVFVAGLFWFVYPQYQRISRDNETTKKNLQIGYESKSRYLRTIDDLKASYQLISNENKRKIEEMVPADSNIPGQIPAIESIILTNSAVLDSIKIDSVDVAGPPKSRKDLGEKQESPAGIFNGPLPDGVKLVKIEIHLSSVNYQVLKNIIKAFENNLRLYDIAKVDYTVLENKAILTIYSYYLVS